MRGPQPTSIELTSQQRDELARITRKASSPQAHVTRAKIILLAAAGDNNSVIATQLGCHRETARKWRERWAAEVDRLATVEAAGEGGELRRHILALLSDQPRSGSPGKFTAEQICQLIALACQILEINGDRKQELLEAESLTARFLMLYEDLYRHLDVNPGIDLGPEQLH